MDSFRPSYFMIAPTMACQASCRYCYAKRSGKVMDRGTAEAAMDFIESIAPEDKGIQVVFHGGEPLLAGAAFYEYVLPELKRRFGARLRLSVQSNLWALNGKDGDRLCELLKIYDVSVGTSLDGFQEMCDFQRGEGYYANTTRGIEKLEQYGIHTGTICTFGKHFADRAKQVFETSKGSYSIHGAVPSIGDGDLQDSEDSMAVSAEEMKTILLDSYHAYRKDPAHARISTIDKMVEGCCTNTGSLCTFKKCLGSFAAVSAEGDVYSCQRFNGYREFSLGNVIGALSEAEILRSDAYKRLREQQRRTEDACRGCSHVQYCKGGCIYSAIAENAEKDPYCEAYKSVFDRIKTDMALEMAASLKERFSEEEKAEEEKAEEKTEEKTEEKEKESLTPVLAMAGLKPHPCDIKMNRERIRSAVERGRTAGVSPAPLSRQAGMRSDYMMEYHRNHLWTMYLNITYRCPLRCTHCSANTGVADVPELSAERFAGIVKEAVESGFRRIEFAGGEIFAYPAFDELMVRLAQIDRKGTLFAFSTSLGFDLPGERIETVCRLFDILIVSIDGDEEFHDRRRGKGIYKKALGNLEYALTAADRRCRFELRAALDAKERRGKEGAAVRKLAEELGISKVTYRSILPLGRACGGAQDNLDTEKPVLPGNFAPRYSCGIGSNMTVEPNGEVYPCYAWCEKEKMLGDLKKESVGEILGRGELFEYRLHGVDTNEKCKHCDVRYLCGGMCRAWVADKENIDSGAFVCNRYDFYKKKKELVLKSCAPPLHG